MANARGINLAVSGYISADAITHLLDVLSLKVHIKLTAEQVTSTWDSVESTHGGFSLRFNHFWVFSRHSGPHAARRSSVSSGVFFLFPALVLCTTVTRLARARLSALCSAVNPINASYLSHTFIQTK